ncbi:MAG: SRPBCC family protein [Paracoccaceae bacterium]
MKFSAQEDIEAPIDRVFAHVSNFEAFERNAIRRGAEIERESASMQPTLGMAWKVRFEFRGRARKVKVKLSELDQPNMLRFDAVGQGVDGFMVIDLLPLSPRRTRLSVLLEIEPKTLSARLLLQSMRLAKTNLNRRFRRKVREFTAAI